VQINTYRSLWLVCMHLWVDVCVHPRFVCVLVCVYVCMCSCVFFTCVCLYVIYCNTLTGGMVSREWDGKGEGGKIREGEGRGEGEIINHSNHDCIASIALASLSHPHAHSCMHTFSQTHEGTRTCTYAHVCTRTDTHKHTHTNVMVLSIEQAQTVQRLMA